MTSLLGALLPSNKDKPAGKTPVPLVSRAGSAFRGAFAPRDHTGLLAGMEATTTVFGIVDKLAGSTSRVEWNLWQKAKSGKPEDRKEITSHPALDLWNKPNRYFTRQETVEGGQQHSELTGETWLVVARDARAKSIPLELWLVSPDRMTPIPSYDKFLVGYEYRAPDGETVPLEIADVLFIRRPDPRNLYRGLGPLKASIVDVESQRYAVEWNKNFFLNSAEPGGIVEIDRRLSDDEFDELVSRWREQHQGVAQAHRVAILEQVKWVDRKYTMRDMQFTELRGVTSAAIKEAFGFPKFMLGQVDDVNRANADASEAMFAKHLIVPRLERWKQMLNNDLLPLYGTSAVGLEFDYVSPVPEDSEAANAARTSKVGAVAQLIPLGFKPKETLKAFDLPDIPFEAPQQPMAPGMPGQPGAPGAPVGANGVPPAFGEGGPQFDPPANAFARMTAHLFNQAPSADLAAVQASWEVALEQLLADYQAQISPAQAAELRAQVEEAVAAGDLSALGEMTVTTTAAAALILAALLALAGTAGAQMAAELAAQGLAGVAPILPAAAVMSELAAATASVLGAGLAAAAGEEALRLATPGVGPAEVAAGVWAWLLTMKGGGLRRRLASALTRSQNEARLLTAKEADDNLPPDVPQILYFASEVNDARTCRQKPGDTVKRCHEIDGHQYDSWIDAWHDYAGGTYKHCLGRDFCRGTVVARWNPEAPI